MPSKFGSYIALLRLVDDASKDLGLSHLTAADRNVLLVMSEYAGKARVAENFTYARYCDLVGEDNAVSRAQFFKSLDRLLGTDMVTKPSAGRSATYTVFG